MKSLIRLFSYLVIALVLILQSACDNGLIEDFVPSEERTFGLRHDKSLSEYEALVLNEGAAYPNFGAVVCFSYSLDGTASQEFVASGTLIDENWILTAGHNFYVAEEQNAPALAGGISVLTGDNPNNPDETYQVSELVFHPTWLQDNMDFINANDLCLVKLATPITHIDPVALYSSNDETINSKVWFSGFGDFSGLAGENMDELSNKHAVENKLDRKVANIETEINGTTYSGGLLAFDFDNPDGSINSLGDEVINEDEALLGDGTSEDEALSFEGATVTGDSGGPLFAGVLSGGANAPIQNHEDGSYGDISIFIRVSRQIEWIESVID